MIAVKPQNGQLVETARQTHIGEGIVGDIQEGQFALACEKGKIGEFSPEDLQKMLLTEITERK